MSDRRLSDWVPAYLEYAKFTEPPISYHTWTALGCISAALERKVFLDWGMERIYPNLYIVLLGAAAQTRKSTALRIGEGFARGINLKIIGQDNSPEAIIREIKGQLQTFGDPSIGHTINMQSAVTCFASELAVFLGRQNADFQAYLTDWYDSPDEWKRTTKHQGVDDITGLCFNLVGAMAPDWIPHVFTPESIGGGFTSRIMFVSENRKFQTIANPNKHPPSNGLKDKLLEDLERIHKITGTYTLSKDAESFYEDWYQSSDRSMQDGVFAVPDRNFHTYCGRRATLLRKVSMCIAASRRDETVITDDDMHTALNHMDVAEKKMPGTFASVARGRNAAQMAAIKKALHQRGEMRKSDLLREFHQDISYEELETVERTLEHSRLISVTVLPDERDSVITWIGGDI